MLLYQPHQAHCTHNDVNLEPLTPSRTLWPVNNHLVSVICLWQVFVCEQLLYTKTTLDQHLKSGDEDGPLAESGFKGHPQCSFCKKRFFGETELFQHNQQRHETCFLCRRANPEEYVYYRDYQQLEGTLAFLGLQAANSPNAHWVCCSCAAHWTESFPVIILNPKSNNIV